MAEQQNVEAPAVGRARVILLAVAVFCMALPTWPITVAPNPTDRLHYQLAWLDPVVPFGSGNFGAPLAMLAALAAWILVGFGRPRAARPVLAFGVVALLINIVAGGAATPVTIGVVLLLAAAAGLGGVSVRSDRRRRFWLG